MPMWSSDVMVAKTPFVYKKKVMIKLFAEAAHNTINARTFREVQEDDSLPVKHLLFVAPT